MRKSCKWLTVNFALFFFQGQPFVFSFGEFLFVCRSLFSFSLVNMYIERCLFSYLSMLYCNRSVKFLSKLIIWSEFVLDVFSSLIIPYNFVIFGKGIQCISASNAEPSEPMHPNRGMERIVVSYCGLTFGKSLYDSRDSNVTIWTIYPFLK